MIDTSEILISKEHIDPLRDQGYAIYKLGRISPVIDGKREANMLWGNVKVAGFPEAPVNGKKYVRKDKGWSEIPEGVGNDIVSDEGMDFEKNKPVKLGIPSTIDSNTENSLLPKSHTHKLGNIDINTVGAKDPAYIGYGALYTWWTGVDTRGITSGSMRVPSRSDWEQLFDFIDTASNTHWIWPLASKKLKEKGFIHWVSQKNDDGDTVYFNEGTDEFSFSAFGAGNRDEGGSYGLKETTFFLSTDTPNDPYNPTDVYSVMLNNGSGGDMGGIVISYIRQASSIRLVREATTEELELPDGLIQATYTGNNNLVYELVKIGTQIWTKNNLNETKFANGDWVHGFEDGTYLPISNEDWALLEGEALCYYADNEALGGGQKPLSVLLSELEHNKLKEIDGGDPENNYYGHLTEEEYNKISKIPDVCITAWGGSELLTAQVYTNLISTSWYPVLTEVTWSLFGEVDGNGIGQDMGMITIMTTTDNQNSNVIMWKHVIAPSSTRIGNMAISLGDYNSLNMYVDFVGDSLPYKFIVESKSFS